MRFEVALDLAAYFDESYCPPNEPVDSRPYIIAGCIARNNVWKKLSKDWKRVEKLNLEDGVVFHAAALEGGYADFSGLGQDERHRLQRLFIKVILKHEVYPFCAGAPHDWLVEYQRTFEQNVKPLKGHAKALVDPYMVAFNFALKTVSSMLVNLDSSDRVDLVFDMECHENRAMAALAHLQQSHPETHSHWSTLSYKRSRDFAPLRVADLVAYESFRKHRDGVERWQLEKLESRHPIRCRYMEAENMEEFMKVFRVES
ncbi:MAG: DUF3800 domain-containing protein [Acidobacteria bacterium]|nr:DUF3800 domain-containing protein [Acidobacteriota bacterium]